MKTFFLIFNLAFTWVSAKTDSNFVYNRERVIIMSHYGHSIMYYSIDYFNLKKYFYEDTLKSKNAVNWGDTLNITKNDEEEFGFYNVTPNPQSIELDIDSLINIGKKNSIFKNTILIVNACNIYKTIDLALYRRGYVQESSYNCTVQFRNMKFRN